MNSSNIKQFIKFGIVGLSNTIIGYIIYLASLKLFRFFAWFPKTDIYIAQFVMFVISVAWSFYWNNKVVFTSVPNRTTAIIKALIKTYTSYAFTSLFLSEVLLAVWVNIFHINEYIAPALSLVITVPLNYILQKKWVFNENRKD